MNIPNTNLDIVTLLIGAGLVSLIWIIFSVIYRKKSIKKEIGTARANLREVYKSYGKELFDIADKIDKHLEVLENA
jgi:hypothetical protein